MSINNTKYFKNMCKKYYHKKLMVIRLLIKTKHQNCSRRNTYFWVNNEYPICRKYLYSIRNNVIFL